MEETQNQTTTSSRPTLDEWLKLGVVERSKSLYNSPIFCIPKTGPRSSGN